MPHVHQFLANEGVFELLQALRTDSRSYYSRDEFISTIRSVGITDPEFTIQTLKTSGVIFDRGDDLGLSTFGIRTCLLLEAVNGADVAAVYQELAALDSNLRMYELVREGMTGLFIRSLIERPGFRRLYICSPWIDLDEKQASMLKYAVYRQEESHGERPEILVLTRPDGRSSNRVPDTLQPFQNLGASIYLNKRLHSKLYIREPDGKGGYLMAIVGSQNLTKSLNIELGIRINSDSQMVNQLIRYYFQVTNSSIECRGDSS